LSSSLFCCATPPPRHSTLSLHDALPILTMPGGTDSLTVVCPIRLDGQPLPVDTRSPALGEHESELRARVRSAPASDDPIAPLREFVVAMTKLVERSDDEPTLIAEGREDRKST